MGPIWGLTRGVLDLLIVLYFAVWFLGARFLLDRLVYKPLAIILLRALLINDEARQSRTAKCSETMWKLTYYVSVQLWVLSIIKQEPWSLDTKQYFKGWPNQELRLSLMLLYMCQCGSTYRASVLSLHGKPAKISL